jgi:hypothetical protein
MLGANNGSSSVPLAVENPTYLVFAFEPTPEMIDKNITVNNEFYVCPVFNQAIEAGKKIRTFDIPKMWGVGTPEDLNYYLEHYKK